jgi:hypothetical protein
VNGVSYPDVIDGSELVVSWAHRDRTQELLLEPTSYLTGNIGPELGVTYNLVIKGENGTVVRTEVGLTASQYSYVGESNDSNVYELAPSGIFVYADGSVETPQLRLNANLEIELKSVRDGLESYQTHTIDVERAGYGFNYGNFYGGANASQARTEHWN